MEVSLSDSVAMLIMGTVSAPSKVQPEKESMVISHTSRGYLFIQGYFRRLSSSTMTLNYAIRLQTATIILLAAWRTIHKRIG
jgi:hypothetical protein